MFNIPQVMLDYWVRKAKPKATPADIAMIEAVIGGKLPAPYVKFVSEIGFVVFDNVPGMRFCFDYALRSPDRMEFRIGTIGCLTPASLLVKKYERATKIDCPEEALPQYPASFLPVGDSLDQSRVLLQIFGDHPGRVWYWPENEDAWGRGTNVALGFVAENFYDFINRLRPREDE